MNTNSPDQQEEDIICSCTGTTKEKVKELIENGADMDKISSATGAGTGCGSCDFLILELLDK